MSKLKPLLLLLAGLLVGSGGTAAYFVFGSRGGSEVRTSLDRFLLPVPAATCKQVMVLGFRAAGFIDVTPDPGDFTGVAASHNQMSGAAMCMPALGAAAVAITGPDPAQRQARMQAFSEAVAATNFAPRAQPQQR